MLKETGYPAPLINLVWHRYSAPIVAAFQNHNDFAMYVDIGIDVAVAIMLYVALWYIHTHPVLSVIGQRDFRDFGKVTEQKFGRMVLPVLFPLSPAVYVGSGFPFRPRQEPRFLQAYGLVVSGIR